MKKGAAPQKVAALVKGVADPSIAALRVPLSELSFPYAFTVRTCDTIY